MRGEKKKIIENSGEFHFVYNERMMGDGGDHPTTDEPGRYSFLA